MVGCGLFLGYRWQISKGLLALGLLGLGVPAPAVAVALEPTVDYTSPSSFTINPTSGNPNQDFGVVRVQSDSATGWVLRVRSLRGGVLKHESHPATVPYSLTVDGIQVGSLVGGNAVTVMTTTSLTCAAPTGCTFPVRATIMSGEAQGKPSGSYTDTLTFTLVEQ
ncbi:hypothetical protein GFS31_42940 (plasmid) [Leptolyngbya sp. BL0902]|uniref:hypothetical protein n=1 Tax=Leptolyngbya sp. BL0902 TaxID=1115757 RepID=UPI0018E72B23|nr:hypothetical protein [Leptolyngbya sp. BL0902]QQE67581.1 hypothetical protein GFS31_42940 [Leptolyngbya sp. BL0902]